MTLASTVTYVRCDGCGTTKSVVEGRGHDIHNPPWFHLAFEGGGQLLDGPGGASAEVGFLPRDFCSLRCVAEFASKRANGSVVWEVTT